MGESSIEGTDDNFEETVIKSDVPVLVDFWAPWCGPCRTVGPILEDLAGEYAGRAKVVKVNVDEEQGVAGSMNVRSIPTVILFAGGEPRVVTVGVKPREHFKKLLDEAIG
jgi:thioredoxin 1